MKNHEPRIAIVYDWLDTKHGGAEQVLQALWQAFPEAHLFSSYQTVQVNFIEKKKIHLSFIQKLKFLHHYKFILALLFPLAFESYNLRDFDIVISVSSAFAKNCITTPWQLHVTYLLSPPRFLYSHPRKYQEQLSGVMKFISKLVSQYLIRYDQAAKLRSDYLIPISQLIARRVEKIYELKPEKPIYPPINLNSFNKLPAIKPKVNLPNNYFLVVSRLESYKNIDIAIKICHDLGQNLVIVGEGSQEKYLKSLTKSVLFLNNLQIPELSYLYKHAQIFLMPQIEDYGISALEAAYFKLPIVMNQNSGVFDILSDYKYTYAVKQSSYQLLKSACLQALSQKIDPNYNFTKLAKYDTNEFIKNFKETIYQLFMKFQKDNYAK